PSSRCGISAKPRSSGTTAFLRPTRGFGACKTLGGFMRCSLIGLTKVRVLLEKWRTQLEGATDDVLQLAAELLYVQGKNSNGDTLGRLADLHRLERRQRLAKRR